MRRILRSRRGRVLLATAAWIIIWVFASVAARAEEEKDFTKLPGYVDFGPMMGGTEPTVEIYLKGSLLVIAREAVKDDDPELSDLLSRIEYVRVQVFPVKDGAAKALEEKANDVAKKLEKKGWELTVRVREEGEQVHVFLLPGHKDNIEGVVVMAIDEDDEAAFINVVGNINPSEIGRIGRTFHIHSMDVPIKVKVEGDAKVTVDEGEKKQKGTE